MLLQAAEPPTAELPLKRVVLFSSGVGFFEHSGEIDGNRTVEMRFDTAAINDLLKSMVVQDFGQGHVSTVTYGSREPLAKQLKSFSIDLARNPTIADLLLQLRGQRLAISMPNPVEGTVVGLERREVPAAKEGMQAIDVLNLKTATGLRSIPLNSIVEFRLLDEKLDKEFQDALAVLASAHTNDKKAVTLNFTGTGKRTVRVGYIQESPVWKTSYRLVLDDKEAPLLQGWAVVENTTEHDWKNVAVTLVSGRPISFLMDLYEPLYVDRPWVAPELFGTLTSHTYDQDMSGKADLEALTGDSGLRIGGKPVRLGNKNQFQTGGGLGGAGGMSAGMGVGGFGAGGSFGTNREPMVTSVVPVVGGPGPNMTLDLKKGVAPKTKAEEVGALFRYAIGTPVTLAHSQSALLPIVNEPIKGERVSIYNPADQSKHPLSGLWLHNTTKLHLMQGPITVFDGGEYAGDAQIEDIAPGASRLISYALDLNVEATSGDDMRSEELTLVKIVHGVLQATTKINRRREYTMKNSGDRAKHVLIEQPIDSDWKLVSTKNLAEQSRDTYRFALDVPEHKTATLAVEEQRRSLQQVRLGVLSDTSALLVYSSAAATSQQVKDAFKELSTRLAARTDLLRQRAQAESQITEIGEEQSRIRLNMQQLDKSSELFKRYVKMFGEQEDLIAKTRAELKTLSAQQEKQRKEFAEFVERLDVD
ncbi:MAG TPA: hypothetical protein VHX65_19170 [Pirellulales bacterium]|jgi:hypothetical protein|nr:hypothetical protein [Pirellulales bacterium]